MSSDIATRRLCAGTYLDSDFGQRVLLDAYADRSRFVAPSYGFRLSMVALHARRAWWVDLAQHGLMLVSIALAVIITPLSAAVAGAVLMLWHVALSVAHLAQDFIRYVRDQRPLSDLAAMRVRLRLLVAQALATTVAITAILIFALGFENVSAVWRRHARPIVVLGFVRQAVGWLVFAMTLVLVFALVRQILLNVMLNASPKPHDELNRRLRHIAIEEQSPVTYYSGFRPFVGSGEEMITWSFALRLLEREAPNHDAAAPVATPMTDEEDERPTVSRAKTEGERELTDARFRSKDLVERIRDELNDLAGSDDPELQMPGLDVRDRVFVVGTSAREIAPDIMNAIETARDEPTGPARHYLACKIEGWGGEIVTTVFVHASLQGRMLYLEFSVWSLLPTRPDFHVVGLSGTQHARMHMTQVLKRLTQLPEEIRRLPGDLWTIVPFCARGIAAMGRSGPRRTGRDPGTVFSTREEGSISPYVAWLAAQRPSDWIGTTHRNVLLVEEADPAQERAARQSVREVERLTRQAARAVNYFQTRDVQRHWKVLERRVLAAVLDFLDEHEIDTDEYRSRAASIINNSVNIFQAPVNAQGAHFGTGNVSNTNVKRD